MHQRDRIEITSRHVKGDLHIPVDFAGKWLVFSNVTFEDTADFTGVRAGGIEFYHCCFKKGIDLSGVDLTGDLIAYKTEFDVIDDARKPSLRLDGARTGGDLRILACVVRGGVAAENLQIQGDADFRGLRVHFASEGPSDAGSEDRAEADLVLWLARHSMNMAFRLTGSKICGSLRLACLYDEPIKGYRVSGAPPQITMLRGNAELSNTEISGDLDLRGALIRGGLSLKYSKVGGSIQAEASWEGLARGPLPVRFRVADVFLLYGLRVGGNIDLSCARLDKGLQVVFSTIEGYFFARQEDDSMPPLQLGRDEEGVSLNLSGSRCLGVDCEGAEMEGLVRAITGEFGRFYLQPRGILAGGSDLRIAPCQTAGVYMQSIVVRENARFAGIRLNDSTLMSRPMTKNEFGGVFSMLNCSVGGDLTIGSDGLCKSVLLGLSRRIQAIVIENCDEHSQQITDCVNKSSIGERIDLSGTSVDRNLILSSVDVERGSIMLDGVTVKGDLRMSHRSYAYSKPAFVKDLQTKCKNLSMNTLRCEGDADVTGLKVTDKVEGRHVNVRGDLLFATGEVDCKADIEGDLTLQGAAASILKLSGENFCHGKGNMDLSDTEFRKIEINAADKLPPRRSGMLQFHNASVVRWEIRPRNTSFHRKTEPVPGGAYVSIEKYYRESGHFDEANQVLRAMRRRSIKAGLDATRRWEDLEPKLDNLRHVLERWKAASSRNVSQQAYPLIRLPFDALRWCCRSLIWLFGESLGFGTRPWPLLAVIVALLAVSTCIFHNPVNVTASAAFLPHISFQPADPRGATNEQKTAGESEGIHHDAALIASNALPSSAAGETRRIRLDPRDLVTSNYREIHPRDSNAPGFGWSWGDALCIAARYNVPLLSLAMEEFWVPSRAVLFGDFKATHWGRLMSYVNWILWPLFLATFTGYLFRRL